MENWTVGKFDSYQTYLQFIATGIFVLLCLIMVLGAFIGGSEIASGDNNQLYNTTTTSQTTASTGKTNFTYLEMNLLQKDLVWVLLFSDTIVTSTTENSTMTHECECRCKIYSMIRQSDLVF